MHFNYLFIFIGGGLGSITRGLLTKILPQSVSGIPLQILIINVIGCFLMGILTQFLNEKCGSNSLIKTFLSTGFLGGFTTFSAFSLDLGLLIEKKLYYCAFIYSVVTVVLSLICFLIGIRILR